MTRPTISSASIASDNSTNTSYATTDDVITIGITASENLINTGSTVFGGNISGLKFSVLVLDLMQRNGNFTIQYLPMLSKLLPTLLFIMMRIIMSAHQI